MEKKRIREAIVVEGKSDEAVVSRVFDTLIITTHGFGFGEDTWKIIDKAYKKKGLIVLTDPDYAGDRIRERIASRCPEARHAYVPRLAATAAGDVGIENAAPESVAAAVAKARARVAPAQQGSVGAGALRRLGLCGCEGAAERRSAVAAELGIGYSNAKTFLRHINCFGITERELEAAIEKTGNAR